MKPKSVGIYLFAILLVYFVLAFFMLGLMGNLIVSVIGYFKFETWKFNYCNIESSLLIGASCGLPMAAGIWTLSKIKAIKKYHD